MQNDYDQHERPEDSSGKERLKTSQLKILSGKLQLGFDSTNDPIQRKVLEAALKTLRGELTVDQLQQTIQQNPGYKKILGPDTTKNLIDATIVRVLRQKPSPKEVEALRTNIAKDETKLGALIEKKAAADSKGQPKKAARLQSQITEKEESIRLQKSNLPGALEAEHQRLFKALETQFAAMVSKPGEKHNDKYQMVKLAMQCLKGAITPAELEAAKAQYPQYNKALFSSATEKLIEETLRTVETPVTAKQTQDELSAPADPKPDDQEDLTDRFSIR